MARKLDRAEKLGSEGVVSLYTTKLDCLQMRTLRELCLNRNFEKFAVDYSAFAFKGPGVNIIAYESGKVVIQGKKTGDFVKFELEPNVTFDIALGYDEIKHPEWFEWHAGMDESGKGDLFGPIVVSCVIAGEDTVHQWVKDGVRDSKSVSGNRAISALEAKILQSDCVSDVMYLQMAKYNELYVKFGKNMNNLLGWMHSCALKNALQKRYVPWGMLDQFSNRPVVKNFLKNSPFAEKGFDLRMQTKAEADPVVAAASILARAEYNRQMDILSKKAGFEISKGAGASTVTQANDIVQKFGYDQLQHFVKMHFSTAPKFADLPDQRINSNDQIP
jgi:ribonuclease HIII